MIAIRSWWLDDVRRVPEKLIQCPKCRYHSGDNWAQCGGFCPMPGSPAFSAAAAQQFGPPLEVTESSHPTTK